jgi:hypothetical protein
MAVPWAAIIAAIPAAIDAGKKAVKFVEDKTGGGGGGDNKQRWRAKMQATLDAAKAAAESAAEEANDAKAVYAFAMAFGILGEAEGLLSHSTVRDYKMTGEVSSTWLPKYNATKVYMDTLQKQRDQGGPVAGKAALHTAKFDKAMSQDFWAKVNALGGAGTPPDEQMQRQAFAKYPWTKLWVVTERPDRAPKWLLDEFKAQGLIPATAGMTASQAAAQDITGGGFLNVSTGTVVAALALYLGYRWLRK